MVTHSTKLPARPSPKALSIVRQYCDNSGDAVHVPDRLISYQARRAQHVASTLTKPGVLVLNDPVGTGKTVIALTAARLLLDSTSTQDNRVDVIVIIAPESTVANTWAERAGFIESPKSRFRQTGGGAPVHVLTRRQFASKSKGWPGAAARRVLFIIDEAHRGLQNQVRPGDSTSFRSQLLTRAEGAHVLLVTATPFQLRPSGVERMLEIDGDLERGDSIREFLNAQASWLRATHDRATTAKASPPSGADTRVGAAEQRVQQALADAAPALQQVLMPTYSRTKMRIPAEFGLPRPRWVNPDDTWLRAYHAARILPVLLGISDDDDSVVRNSDTYMRMLTSSRAAWHDTTVYAAVDKSHSKAIHTLVAELDQAMGPAELDHPKVAATARMAIKEAARARKPHHVLIFCVFRMTQQALYEAITDELCRQGLEDTVQVEKPHTAHQAKTIANASGFRNPVGNGGAPVIIIARDNLSESIDLDGGQPVVIHHDLSWSPVRWPQRLGRVVRASSGFTEPAKIIVPVLTTSIDKRLWQTLKGRKNLTSALVPNPKLRSLLDESLLDWDEEP